MVELEQAACGALLRDDFNSGEIDTALWRASSLDPGIKVEIENGELCIRGTSALIPEEKLRSDLAALSRYAGLYSRSFSQVDVALAVKVKTPSGISHDPGAHVVNVHLCGVHPDCYSEVLFGKLEAEPSEKLLRDYSGRHVPYQDARGWWFGIINQDPGRFWWRVSGEAIPEQGDERERFYEVVVDYDEPTRLSRAYLNLGNRWVRLGNRRQFFEVCRWWNSSSQM